MEYSKIILFSALCTLCSSCKKSNDYFIGKWNIVEMGENEKVIPITNNWIHLKPNQTFESYDGDLKKREKGIGNTSQKTKFYSLMLLESIMIVSGS